MATCQTDEVHQPTPDSLSWRQAHQALAAAQKSPKGAGAYGRFINRPLGRRFAATAYVLNWTPNLVTAVSALFTFSGIAVIAALPPSVTWSLLSGSLLIIGYGLDAADGQLARLQASGSPAGEFLDHTVDSLKSATVHLAILISWYRFDDRLALLFIPIAFQVVENVQFSSFLLLDRMRRTEGAGASPEARTQPTNASVLYSLAKLPEDYGLLCIVICLRFWTTGFTAAYTFLMLTATALLLIALPRRYQEIKSYSLPPRRA